MEVIGGTVLTMVDDDGVAATVAAFVELLGTIVGDGLVEAWDDITNVVVADCVDGVVTTVVEPFVFCAAAETSSFSLLDVTNPIRCTLPVVNGRWSAVRLAANDVAVEVVATVLATLIAVGGVVNMIRCPLEDFTMNRPNAFELTIVDFGVILTIPVVPPATTCLAANVGVLLSCSIDWLPKRICWLLMITICWLVATDELDVAMVRNVDGLGAIFANADEGTYLV